MLARTWGPRIVLVVGMLGLVGGARICGLPLDVSGTIEAPPVVTTVKSQDDFAYVAHTALASMLGTLHCSPLATAVQWLKAAAHARSPAEVRQTASGLVATRTRDGPSDDFQRALCMFLAGRSVSPAQALALAEAGITCASAAIGPPE